jgi:hypothetical protein
MARYMTQSNLGQSIDIGNQVPQNSASPARTRTFVAAGWSDLGLPIDRNFTNARRTFPSWFVTLYVSEPIAGGHVDELVLMWPDL